MLARLYLATSSPIYTVAISSPHVPAFKSFAIVLVRHYHPFGDEFLKCKRYVQSEAAVLRVVCFGSLVEGKHNRKQTA